MKGDTEKSGLLRLMIKELGGSRNVTKPVFVGVEHIPHGNGPDECRRGDVTALIYYCIWKGSEYPQNAMIEDPLHLPGNVMGFHRILIARAMAQYRKITGGGKGYYAD